MKDIVDEFYIHFLLHKEDACHLRAILDDHIDCNGFNCDIKLNNNQTRIAIEILNENES